MEKDQELGLAAFQRSINVFRQNHALIVQEK